MAELIESHLFLFRRLHYHGFNIVTSLSQFKSLYIITIILVEAPRTVKEVNMKKYAMKSAIMVRKLLPMNLTLSVERKISVRDSV